MGESFTNKSKISQNIKPRRIENLILFNTKKSEKDG